jgi:hypothetical protein
MHLAIAEFNLNDFVLIPRAVIVGSLFLPTPPQHINCSKGILDAGYQCD